jgi:hypothetical protein
LRCPWASRELSREPQAEPRTASCEPSREPRAQPRAASKATSREPLAASRAVRCEPASRAASCEPRAKPRAEPRAAPRAARCAASRKTSRSHTQIFMVGRGTGQAGRPARMPSSLARQGPSGLARPVPVWAGACPAGKPMLAVWGSFVATTNSNWGGPIPRRLFLDQESVPFSSRPKTVIFDTCLSHLVCFVYAILFILCVLSFTRSRANWFPINCHRSGSAQDSPYTPVFTGPGPLGTGPGLAVPQFLQVRDRCPGLASQRSRTARDSPYPSFHKSGAARDWPGTRRTPIFTGPGPLGTGPGLAVPQFLQVRDRLGLARDLPYPN